MVTATLLSIESIVHFSPSLVGSQWCENVVYRGRYEFGPINNLIFPPNKVASFGYTTFLVKPDPGHFGACSDSSGWKGHSLLQLWRSCKMARELSSSCGISQEVRNRPQRGLVPVITDLWHGPRPSTYPWKTRDKKLAGQELVEEKLCRKPMRALYMGVQTCKYALNQSSDSLTSQSTSTFSKGEAFQLNLECHFRSTLSNYKILRVATWWFPFRHRATPI